MTWAQAVGIPLYLAVVAGPFLIHIVQCRVGRRGRHCASPVAGMPRRDR